MGCTGGAGGTGTLNERVIGSSRAVFLWVFSAKHLPATTSLMKTTPLACSCRVRPWLSRAIFIVELWLMRLPSASVWRVLLVAVAEYGAPFTMPRPPSSDE